MSYFDMRNLIFLLLMFIGLIPSLLCESIKVDVVDDGKGDVIDRRVNMTPSEPKGSSDAEFIREFFVMYERSCVPLIGRDICDHFKTVLEHFSKDDLAEVSKLKFTDYSIEAMRARFPQYNKVFDDFERNVFSNSVPIPEPAPAPKPKIFEFKAKAEPISEKINENEVCRALMTAYADSGMLTRNERTVYCKNSCGGLISCVHKDEAEKEGVYEYLRLFFFTIADPKIKAETFLQIQVSFTERHYEFAYELFWWLAPIMIGLISVGLMRWFEVKDRFSIFGWVLFVLTISYPLTKSRAIVFFNLTCIVMMFFIGDRAALPYDVVGIFVGFFLFLFSSFLLSAHLQLFLIFVMVISFIGFLKFVFVDKRSISNMAAILLIAIVMVLIDMCLFINDKLMLWNPSFIVINSMLFALIPYGKSGAYITNVAYFISSFMKFYTWDVADKAYFSLIYFIIETVFFLMFRGFIGCSFIMSMKVQFTPELLFKGINLYMINLVMPLRYSSMLITGQMTWTSKNVFMGFGMLLLMGIEFTCTFDFMMLRLFFLAFNYLLGGNQELANIPQLLSYNIDLNDMSFPCDNSRVFLSLNKLCEVGQCAVRAVGMIRGKEFPLAGAIRNSTSNKVSLFTTIAHNLRDVDSVKLFDKTYDKNSIHESIYSDSDDPVIGMELDDKYNIGRPFSFITDDEVRFIDYIFVIIPSENDEGPMINILTNWKVDNRGQLHLSVDLKRGDSGSPVFAILKDTGAIRYCGAVSKGTTYTGSANIFSFVNTRADEQHSSDDDSADADFNRRRNRNSFSKFQRLIDNRDALLKEWRQSLEDRYLVQKNENKDKVDDYDPYNLPDYADFDQGFYKSNDRRDAKRRNKDRAMIKRRLALQAKFKKLCEDEFRKSNKKYCCDLIQAFNDGCEIDLNNNFIYEFSNSCIIDTKSFNLFDGLTEYHAKEKEE